MTTDELRKFIDSFMTGEEEMVVDVKNWCKGVLRFSTDNHYLIRCIYDSVNYETLNAFIRKELSTAEMALSDSS
jgi:hypothetical protein